MIFLDYFKFRKWFCKEQNKAKECLDSIKRKIKEARELRQKFNDFEDAFHRVYYEIPTCLINERSIFYAAFSDVAYLEYELDKTINSALNENIKQLNNLFYVCEAYYKKTSYDKCIKEYEENINKVSSYWSQYRSNCKLLKK